MVFHDVMPTNIGIMTGKVRELKRRFNEDLFSTKHLNSMFGSIHPLINDKITEKPTHSSDFGLIALQIISEMYLGTDSPAHRKIMGNFMRYCLEITDVSLKSLYYRLVKHKKEAGALQKLVREAMEHNFTSLNKKPSNVMTHVFQYVQRFQDGNDGDIENEFPHWFVPLHNMIVDSVPHLLHIILSFPELFDAVQEDINSPHFDLYSRHTYLHFCVLEHLRLFNIINLNMTRKATEDFY